MFPRGNFLILYLSETYRSLCINKWKCELKLIWVFVCLLTDLNKDGRHATSHFQQNKQKPAYLWRHFYWIVQILRERSVESQSDITAWAEGSWRPSDQLWRSRLTYNKYTNILKCGPNPLLHISKWRILVFLRTFSDMDIGQASTRRFLFN